MRWCHSLAAFLLASVLCSPSFAQDKPQVLVTVSDVQTSQIGPGAPAHVIGLQRHQQTIVMDTAAQTFGLRYVVARHPEDAQAAIPGEGYIGMVQPSNQNWYAGGFFDLRLNGKSIGGKLIHSLTGRSSGDRGTADFVFDTSQAVVRVRFVAKTGGDCLYTQVLLEPKQEITSVRVAARCYPSGYIQDGHRQVQTTLREFAQGDRAILDVKNEWWTLYYDRVYYAGYIGTTRSGVGPCAMLWVPGQTGKVAFTVGSYGIETLFDLDPTLRDFRFIFFDYAGKKNETAKADLRGRAQKLLEELTNFAFTDPSVAEWPLAQKQAEVERVLKSVPDDKEAAARYERWGRELAAQLKMIHSGSSGAIMAEANAAAIIGQWERAKQRELARWSLLFQREYEKLPDIVELSSETSAGNNASNHERIAFLSRTEYLYERITEMSVWPFEVGTFRKFFSLIIVPLVLFVIQLLIQGVMTQ